MSASSIESREERWGRGEAMVAIHSLLLIVSMGTSILKLMNYGATENGIIVSLQNR